MSKKIKAVFVIFALSLSFFFLVSDALAGNIYLQPGQVAPSQACSLSSAAKATDCPTTSTECFNSAKVGVTDCGTACDGGAAWTKYSLLGCRQTDFDTCDNYWDPASTPVYSTADKCSNGSNTPPPESYLRSGRCDGSIGTIYKTCCTNTSPSLVSSNSCVPISPSSGAPTPPMDGVCPGGTQWVMCGVSQATCNDVIASGGRCTTAACGQEACGPVGPVCGNGTCEAGEDVSSCRADCLEGPNLTSFTGVSGNGRLDCYQATYSATITWNTDATPLPSSDPGCPNGFWVDVDDNPDFSSYSNTCVTGTSLTSNGHDRTWNSLGSFSFTKGTAYYTRVYNGKHSNSLDLTVPPNACINTATCTLDPACDLNTKNCNFNTTYSVNNQSIVSYNVTLHPGDGSTKTGTSSPLTYTYTGNGPYTPTAETTDGTNPAATCQGQPVSFPTAWIPPACSSNGAFSGCNDTGQNRCTNYGDPAKPTWNICNTACNYPGGPDKYCVVEPSCSIYLTPNPDGQSSPGTWKQPVDVITTTNNMPGGSVRLYNPGGNPGTCTMNTCPNTGWTPLFGLGTDRTNTTSWNPNGIIPASGGTYTFGVADANNILRCVTNPNETFNPSTKPACTLTASPASTTNSTLTSTLTATVDTTGMPGSKLSWWDCGDGTPATTDNSSTHTCAYETSQNFLPSFKVVDCPSGSNCATTGGSDLSQTCQATVVVGTGGGTGSGTGCSISPESQGSLTQGTRDYKWFISTRRPPESFGSLYPATFTDNMDHSQSSYDPAPSCAMVDNVYTCGLRTNPYTYSVGSRVSANFSDGWDNKCSYTMTVGAGPPPSCGSPSSYTFPVTVKAFDDPNFDSGNWPQYKWESNQGTLFACWAGENSDPNVEGVSTSRDDYQAAQNKPQVLAAQSCWNNNDCANLTNACATATCQDVGLFWPGNCIIDNKQRGTGCGTSPNGGNLYCSGTGTCSDDICYTSENGGSNPDDCKTSSGVCKSDLCRPPLLNGDPVAGWGNCVNDPVNPHAVCGITPYGGNLYCGAFDSSADGICYNAEAGVTTTSLCKTNDDCKDGNSCSNDICTNYSGAYTDPEGFHPERLGTCYHSNLPPATVCEKDTTTGNPFKVCSTGSSPLINPLDPAFIAAQCNVNYVPCTSLSQNDQYCCGTTNIQGNSCNGTCIQTFNAANNPQPPLSGVKVHVEGEQCPTSRVGFTDANGQVTFSSLPMVYRGTSTPLTYKVWVDPQEQKNDILKGYLFTRGLYERSSSTNALLISPTRMIPPPTDPLFARVGPRYSGSQKDGFNIGTVRIQFGFQKFLPAWIQTTGGDVHSNVNINTPGGP